mgnify:FL=1
MNLNKGCIEIETNGARKSGDAGMNLNKGCIEMMQGSPSSFIPALDEP